MTTPTTTHVLGRERIPSMFRPGAQARLVPTEPLNPAASQDMLPGMGDVRSGNSVTDNGLAPRESEMLHRQVVAQHIERLAGTLNAQVKQAQEQMIALQAEVDAIKAKGDRANSSVIQRKKAALAQLKQKVLDLQQRRAQIIGGARPIPGQMRQNLLPPWQRMGIFKWKRRWIGREGSQFLEATPMQMVAAPATPDPLRYEPTGISYQKGQGRIRDMQLNIQPVESFAADQAHRKAYPGQTIDGVMDFVDPVLAWTKSSTFNVPNWMWLSGAGLATLLLVAKKRSRRTVILAA